MSKEKLASGTLTAPRTESPFLCDRVSAPRGNGGAMQMMHVSLNHVAAVTSPPSYSEPNLHVNELERKKPVPCTSTSVRPFEGPRGGLIPETVGKAT